MSLEQLGPMENKFYKEYAGDIYKSGEHLLTIINEILDISRIEADRYELNEGPLHLTSVTNDCLRMLDIKINSKQITLSKNMRRTSHLFGRMKKACGKSCSMF